mmetsp:Transcript_5009/g.15026  ORF Transcript_5009/g.15026 Transcript_5009/m.15026 type:complete len:250 (-) Transcript_5009:76-825(-)|eukprot:CAMPEP_0198726846 /NCGR_PEP_ID=MMETSP1475-20131203/3769_1 /TAXON_ID= ORGANISM="Unidentified sp., Strain CCMP1999" /NCGR_SAMPLE_ID=MMETSP1475 /ASSEMBLY_ACC=CAM_ASM_001111 /LENGTH=249 /DNA_ID=CAMNT_0044488819 /DNA_START=81 /DNA_END=830 /DNA_ORIENTATION=-
MVAFVGNLGLVRSLSRAVRAERAAAGVRVSRKVLVRASRGDGSSGGEDEYVTTKAAAAVGTVQGNIEKYARKIQEIDVDDLQRKAAESGAQLRENFVAGEWLTRGEFFGISQIVLALLIVSAQSGLNDLAELIFGPAALIIGSVMCARGLADLGVKQLSIWPRPAPNGTLKTSGLYRLVRHPIYSGVIISSFGFSVSTGSPGRLTLTLVLAILLSKKISAEEEFLEEVYGDQYTKYAKAVKYKLFPKLY